MAGIRRIIDWHPKTGKFCCEGSIEGCGQGASSFSDGGNALIQITEACSRNPPAEVEETRVPVMVERGDPLKRDTRAVARDVRYGYVSVENARNEYGVVANPSTLEVYIEATKRPRKGE